ncbi:MAG: D-methionine transport system substrate-binding protein [Pseudomonadota bacterium]|jgi:D-methionine transport system substrate-binding protein
MLKKIIYFLLSGFLLSIGACQQHENPQQIRLGTISGPETELMQIAKQVAQRDYGLNLKIIEFSDYSLPNRALNDGSLDANLFQHQAFLNDEIRNRNYSLVAIAKEFIYPMAIYSVKIRHLTDLRPQAIVAIPNDPSNEARALLLLSSAGLLTLDTPKNTILSPSDIRLNPKHLIIKELDAAQLPRVLADVDLAVINANYAALAQLYPQRDALFSEGKNSIYANLLVVKTTDKNNPKFINLIKAIHSPEVIAAADRIFHGTAVPAWK